MRPVSGAFATHLSSHNPAVARVWAITKRDGSVLRFTDHDSDLLISGNTYLSTNSMVIRDMTQSASKGSQSSEATIMLSDDAGAISIQDISDGLMNSASISVGMTYWSNPADGVMDEMVGKFGTIVMDRVRKRARVELIGLMQQAMQGVGEKYSPECRASLYDARCGVSAAANTTTGVVDTVNSQRQFISTLLVNPPSYDYSLGRLTWTSGANTGRTLDVIEQFSTNATQDTILTMLPSRKPISIGDTFSIVKGCDKRPETCRVKFANMVNFRGEPNVPGNDALLDNSKGA